MAPLHAVASILAMTAVCGIVSASSNTVAISHRSYGNNYSNGLNVVKSDPREEEEYVTSFYSRVREKRRAMFGHQLEQQSKHPNLNHSLDHYFNHRIRSPIHRTSNAARSVRGGGVAPRLAQRSSSASSTGRQHHENSYNEDNMSRNDRVLENSYSHRSSHHNSHDTQQSRQSHSTDEYDDYDDYNDEMQVQSQVDEDEGDDTPDHHLGLLRVPCSIAINSGEATNHAGCSPQAKTPMAAYVDTGAQVTVISASAARRAGIYHLMDRRYAGRATGVGHCKVLGRIPARHVYFLLGEGCDEDDQDYGEFEDGDSWSDDDAWSDGDDYNERDYRGGNGEYHQEKNYHNEPSSSSNTVQMDGPALTVLEGTGIQGVDVLLGLDVLQDWEAEISMSPRRKSITVKKQRGSGGSSVVIPFATTAAAAASRSRYPRKVNEEQQKRRTNRHPLLDIASDTSRPMTSHHHSHSRRHHARQLATSYHPHKSNYSHDTTNFSRDEFYDKNEDEDDFSPNDSDIESDLDLLDQSGHEFHPAERKRASLMNDKGIQRMEDELLGIERVSEMDGEERDDDDDSDDYLQDVDYEEDTAMDGEDEIDMSGL